MGGGKENPFCVKQLVWGKPFGQTRRVLINTEEHIIFEIFQKIKREKKVAFQSPGSGFLQPDIRRVRTRKKAFISLENPAC